MAGSELLADLGFSGFVRPVIGPCLCAAIHAATVERLPEHSLMFGLIMMENGLYLLGLSMTKGLPLIIEFGVFFDVLVAVIVLGILTWRLKLSFQTTDTTVLRKLKG